MYNPNDMPKTPEEFAQLVDHYYSQDVARHANAVAEVKAQAEKQYAALPDSKDKPSLADFIAQAVSIVEPPKSRQEWENHFNCFRIQPQSEPTPAPTLEELRQEKKAELAAA